MICNRRHFLGAIAAWATSLAAPKAFAAVRSESAPALLARAREALAVHGGAIAHHDVMGLVDFGLPSGLPRFDLVDIGNGRVLTSYLVSHGRGSDPGNSGWAERFSNRPGSNASSRGSFVTGSLYNGKHGRSRKIAGLDPENNLAEERAIVIHGAGYVSPGAALAQGRIGRSEGCFAVSWGDIGDLLENLGEGRLLYAWK